MRPHHPKDWSRKQWLKHKRRGFHGVYRLAERSFREAERSDLKLGKTWSQEWRNFMQYVHKNLIFGIFEQPHKSTK